MGVNAEKRREEMKEKRRDLPCGVTSELCILSEQRLHLTHLLPNTAPNILLDTLLVLVLVIYHGLTNYHKA